MESVQHSAVRASAAGGRTMTGRAPHETGAAGSFRVRPRRFGREPAGVRPPEADSVGSGFPCGNRPGDTGRRRPQDCARGPLRGGAGSLGAAGRVPGAGPARTKPCVTTVCADFRALRHRSARCSIALDNCRYQPYLVNPVSRPPACGALHEMQSPAGGGRYVVVIQGFSGVRQGSRRPRSRDTGRTGAANYGNYILD